MSRTHELKTEARYWDRIRLREKPFELRKNDRDFQVRDGLNLTRCDSNGFLLPTDDGATLIMVEVSYILHGPLYGLKKGYCIMGIKEVETK